jgi:hypothetical protein
MATISRMFSNSFVKETVSRSVRFAMTGVSRRSRHIDRSLSGVTSRTGEKTPVACPRPANGSQQQSPVKPHAGTRLNTRRHLMAFE